MYHKGNGEITALELEKELQKIRRRDRLIRLFTGVFVVVMLSFGVVSFFYSDSNSALALFTGREGFNSKGFNSIGYPGNVKTGFNTGEPDIGPSFAGDVYAGGTCCATPTDSSGGSCGMTGSNDGGDAATELEKLALAKYREETGGDGHKAKVTDFGCHLQVDILDAGGKTVRSYGYQGGPLYVIK